MDFNIHVICLFCGSGKPDPVEEYLEDLIYELVEIQNTVYHCEGVDYSFRIKAFSCDAPAQAFLKCIVRHTSDYGCERCHKIALIFFGGGDALIVSIHRLNLPFKM